MKLLHLFETLAEELPMDEASRMERAKAMGFDTSIEYYHGTPDNRGIRADGFEAPDSKYPFFYFTPDTSVAKTYTTGRIPPDYENSVPEVVPVYLRWKNATSLDWGGNNFSYDIGNGKWIDVSEEIAKLHDAGHDAVIVTNINDQYGGNFTSDYGDPSTIVVVFKPNQIRSINAKFNPRKNNSPRIMENNNIWYHRSPTKINRFTTPSWFTDTPHTSDVDGDYIYTVKISARNPYEWGDNDKEYTLTPTNIDNTIEGLCHVGYDSIILPTNTGDEKDIIVFFDKDIEIVTTVIDNKNADRWDSAGNETIPYTARQI